LQNICLKGKPHLTSTINSPGATMAAENQAALIDCGEVAKRGTTYSGFRSGQMAPCALEAYLDGRRTELMVDDLDLRSVIAIEVYPLASLTPGELGAGRCGAVSVWTGDPKR
jgi:hypothetical protein